MCIVITFEFLKRGVNCKNLILSRGPWLLFLPGRPLRIETSKTIVFGCRVSSISTHCATAQKRLSEAAFIGCYSSILRTKIFKKHELRIVNSGKYKRLTASSRGPKCKKFCKICCCKNFAKFLHNFWLILFSRRGSRMRDWRPLLLFIFNFTCKVALNEKWKNYVGFLFP